MKKSVVKILAVLMSVTMLLSCVAIIVSAQGTPTVTVSEVTGKAGETVDVTVSVANNLGIVNMLLNMNYDSDVLELVDVVDAGQFGTTYHTKEKTTVPYVLNWADDVGESNMTYNGLLVTLTFKISEEAGAGVYDITLSYDENGDIYDMDWAMIDFAIYNGSITVDSTSASSSYVINDKITVFELEAVYVDTDSNQPIVTLSKGSSSYEFLYKEHYYKNLLIKVNDRQYYLYDRDLNKIALDETNPKEIALVYDDVKGTLRCYVDGNIAYYYTSKEEGHLVNDLPIDDVTFASATGTESVSVGAGVTLTASYNIGDSGTSEIVAFQEHNDESAIRILAGVDMPWYGAIGFELEVYKDGVGQGVETRSSQTIFESILSNEMPVEADTYGHNFFAACTINGIDVSNGSSYYINVKHFTKVGETTYYGTLAKINIDANGDYSFDESSN